MQRGGVPDDGRAPVVADQNGLLFTEMIDEPEDVADQALHVIGFERGGRVAAAIATHVGHRDAVAGRAQRRDLVAPRVPGLRPAVHHDGERPVALHDAAQAYSIGFDQFESAVVGQVGSRQGGNPNGKWCKMNEEREKRAPKPQSLSTKGLEMGNSRGKAVPTLQIDNDRVVVTEWRFAPGAETGWHRHAHDYVVVPQTTETIIRTHAANREAQSRQGVLSAMGALANVVNAKDRFVFVEVEIKNGSGDEDG